MLLRNHSLLHWSSAVALAFALASPVMGQGLNPDEIRGQTPESKKDVSVVHSRFFKKTYRAEIGLMIGFATDEAYFDSSGIGGRASFWFSESLGIEAQYIKMDYEKSDDYKALENLSKIEKKKDPNTGFLVPEINPQTQAIDVNVAYAPFYGKLNLANWITVYTDIYFTLGFSKVETEHNGITDEDYNAILVGMGDRLYFSDHISFRTDFRARMYTEQRNGEDFFKKAYYVDFGLSYFF